MKKMLCMLFSALVSIMASAQEGVWSGELEVQGMKLPLVFHFSENGCTMDSPSQGAKGIKAEKSYTPEGKLKIDIPAIHATFEGVMVMKMITGTFMQGGASLPLMLKPGTVAPKRPQTPKAPFPYTTEEVTFQNGEFTLSGTLTLPDKATRQTPVAVMVTGSGQQNRDEEIMDHRPFAVIADALARHGIATLRFDDRGYEILGFPYMEYTVADHKMDAEAAVALLRKKFVHVGVIGHSEGGTIGLMLASEGKIDFCISLAGMAVSGKECLLQQNRMLLGSLPQEVADAYCEVLHRVYDDVTAGKSVELADDSLLPESLKENFKIVLSMLSTPYMRDFLTVDVREALPKVKCPVLAMNGKKDMQVDCEANLEAIDRGLANSPHEVVAYDDLNHLFQHCQTGMVFEYANIEETISEDVLKAMIQWMQGIKSW